MFDHLIPHLVYSSSKSTAMTAYLCISIILMGKRELVALLNLSSWCLVMVERLFLTVPWGCLRFVIVVFPDHTYYFCLSLSAFKGCKNQNCMTVLA